MVKELFTKVGPACRESTKHSTVVPWGCYYSAITRVERSYWNLKIEKLYTEAHQTGKDTASLMKPFLRKETINTLLLPAISLANTNRKLEGKGAL